MFYHKLLARHSSNRCRGPASQSAKKLIPNEKLPKNNNNKCQIELRHPRRRKMLDPVVATRSMFTILLVIFILPLASFGGLEATKARASSHDRTSETVLRTREQQVANNATTAGSTSNQPNKVTLKSSHAIPNHELELLSPTVTTAHTSSGLLHDFSNGSQVTGDTARLLKPRLRHPRDEENLSSSALLDKYKPTPTHVTNGQALVGLQRPTELAPSAPASRSSEASNKTGGNLGESGYELESPSGKVNNSFSLRNLDANLEAYTTLKDTVDQLHYSKALELKAYGSPAADSRQGLEPGVELIQEQANLLPVQNNPENSGYSHGDSLVPIFAHQQQQQHVVVSATRAPVNIVEYPNEKLSSMALEMARTMDLQSSAAEFLGGSLAIMGLKGNNVKSQPLRRQLTSSYDDWSRKKGASSSQSTKTLNEIRPSTSASVEPTLAPQWRPFGGEGVNWFDSRHPLQLPNVNQQQMQPSIYKPPAKGLKNEVVHQKQGSELRLKEDDVPNESRDAPNLSEMQGDSDDSDDPDDDPDDGGPEEQISGNTKFRDAPIQQKSNKYTGPQTIDSNHSQLPRVVTSRRPSQFKPTQVEASTKPFSSNNNPKLQPFSIDNNSISGAEVIKGRPLNSEITPEPPASMLPNRSFTYHHPQQATGNFMYPFYAGPMQTPPQDYRPIGNNIFPVVKAYYMTGGANNPILDTRNSRPPTLATPMSISPSQAMNQILELKMREIANYQSPQKSGSQLHFSASSTPVESIGGGEWKMRIHNFEKPLAGAYQMAAPDLTSMQPPAHLAGQQDKQYTTLTSNQHTTRAERENYSKTTDNSNNHLLTINLDTRHQHQPSVHTPFFWEPNNRFLQQQQRPMMTSQEPTWYLANVNVPLTNGHAYAGSLLANQPSPAESSLVQHSMLTSAPRQYSSAFSGLFNSAGGEFLPFASTNFHSFASFPGSEQKEQLRLQKLQQPLRPASFNGSSVSQGKPSPGIISAALSLASPSSVSDAFGWPVDYGSLASKSLLKVNHVAPAPAFLLPHNTNTNHHKSSGMPYQNLVASKTLPQASAYDNLYENHFSVAESQDYGNWQPLALPYKKSPASTGGNFYTVKLSTRRPAIVTKRRTLWNRFRLFRPSNSSMDETRYKEDSSHRRHKRALLEGAKKFLTRKLDQTTRRQSSKTSYIPLVPRDTPLSQEAYDFSENMHHFASSQVPTILFRPSQSSIIHSESQMMDSGGGFFLDPEASIQSSNHLEPPANMPGALTKPPKQAPAARLVELSKNILKSSTRPLKGLMKMTSFSSKFSNTTSNNHPQQQQQPIDSQTASSQTYLTLAQQFAALSSPSVMMASPGTSSLQNFNQFAVPIQYWYQQQLRSIHQPRLQHVGVSQPLLPLATHFSQPISPYSLITGTKPVAPLQFNNNNNKTILDPAKLFATATNKHRSAQQEPSRGSLIFPSSPVVTSHRDPMLMEPAMQHLSRTVMDLQPISSRIYSQQLHPSMASFSALPLPKYPSAHQLKARADTIPVGLATNIRVDKEAIHQELNRIAPGQRPASTGPFMQPSARTISPFLSWPSRLSNIGPRFVELPQRSMISGRDLRSGFNLFSGSGDLFERTAAAGREATSLHGNISLLPNTDLFQATNQRSMEFSGSQREAANDILDVNKAMENAGSLDTLSEADFGVMSTMPDELQSILPTQFGNPKSTSESIPLQTGAGPLGQQQLYQQQQQQFLNAQQHQQQTQQILQTTPNAQQLQIQQQQEQLVPPRPHLSKIIPSINSMASKFRQHLFQTFKLNPARWPSMLGVGSGFVSSSHMKYQLPTGSYLQSASQLPTVKPALERPQPQVIPVQSSVQQLQTQAQVQANAQAQAQAQSQAQHQQQQQFRYITQQHQQQHQQQHPGPRPMESQITGSYYNFRPFEQPKQQQLPQMATHMSNYGGDGQLMGQQSGDFQIMSNQGFHMRPPQFKGPPEAELNSVSGIPEPQHLDESQLIYTDRIPGSAMEYGQVPGQQGNGSMEELQAGADMYESQELMVPVGDYGAMGIPMNATVEHQYVPVAETNGNHPEMTDVRGNLVTSDGTYIQEETQTAGQPNQLELAAAIGADNSSTIHHHHVVVVDQMIDQPGQPQVLDNNYGPGNGDQPAEPNGDKQMLTSGSQHLEPSHHHEVEIQHIYSQPPANQHQRLPQQYRARVPVSKGYRKKNIRVVGRVEKQSDYQVIKASADQQQPPHQLTEMHGAPYGRKELTSRKQQRVKQNPSPMEQMEQQQQAANGHVYENQSLDQVLVYQNQQQATEQPTGEPQASGHQSAGSNRQVGSGISENQPSANQTGASQSNASEQQAPQMEYVFYRPVAGEMNATQLEQFEEPSRPATNLSSGTRLVQQQMAGYQSQQTDSSSSSQLDSGSERPSSGTVVMDTSGSQSTGGDQYLMVEPAPSSLSNQPAFTEVEPQSESNSSPKLAAGSTMVSGGEQAAGQSANSGGGGKQQADRIFVAGKRRHLKTPKSAQQRLHWGQQLTNRSLSAESRLDAQVVHTTTTTTTTTTTAKPIRDPMQSLIKNHSPALSSRDPRPTGSPSLASLSRDSFTRAPKAKIRWQGMGHQRMGNVSSASPVITSKAQELATNKTDFQLASEMNRADQQAAWIVGEMTHQSFSGQQLYRNASSDVTNSTATQRNYLQLPDTGFRRTELNLQQNTLEPPVSNLSTASTNAPTSAPASKPARTGSTSFRLSSSSSSGLATNSLQQVAQPTPASAASTSQAPAGRQQEPPPAASTLARTTPPMENLNRAPSERPTVFSGAAPNSTLVLMSHSSASQTAASSNSPSVGMSAKLPESEQSKIVEVTSTTTTEPRASETTEFQEQVAHISNYTQTDKSTQADLITESVVNYF